jgi:DNA-binding GntR family transcriptional regulator
MTAVVDRVEIAYRALRQAIIEQALLPGTRLPEDELGRHFGMSRTLARTVLTRLQSLGLVDTVHKRTATVAQPSLQDAREVFAVRRALEREVVRLVARRWNATIEAALEAHVREEAEAVAQRNTRVSMRLAGEFHLRLAEHAGNAVLERYLSELVSRCSLILAVYSRPHSAECAVNEHSAIIDALRHGDAARVEALMESHLGLVETRALIADGSGEPPALAAVLGRYSPPAATNLPASRLKRIG